MNASRDVTAHPNPASLDLICDFLPKPTEAELNDSIKQAEGRKTVGAISPEEFPRRFWETLLRLAEVPAETRIAELGRAPRERLVQQIKRAAIPLSGTRGYAQAEVTAGGCLSTKSIRRRCKAAWYRGCTWQVKSSIWTDQSAATIFKRRSAPAGWPEKTPNILPATALAAVV